MTNYIISYDLNGPKPTHAEMDAHVSEQAVWYGRVLETVWYVCYGGTRQQLFQHLKSILGPEDRLLVVEAVGATWDNLLIKDESLKSTWESCG